MLDTDLPSEQQRVSVVIATLGGDSLSHTIVQLNRGSLVPAEILVCIPEQDASRTEQLLFDNVKIIKTACRGQVAQRALGFQQVSNDLVLQLDDDILLRPTCLESLVDCIRGSANIAVGPKLYDIKSGKYHSFLIPDSQKNFLLQKLIFWVLNGRDGYEPGRIGRAGIGMGIPETPGTWTDIGWLPGGCVLHRRKNLVLFDFYPFKGKAFAEDLFHAELLRNNGVKLTRSGSAACDVDFSSPGGFSPINYLKDYLVYANALKRFALTIGRKPNYLYMYLVLNLVMQAVKKLLARNPTAK